MHEQNGFLTFTEFSQLWLRDHAAARMKPTGYAAYESVIRLHLVPAFGHRLLVDITPAEVAQFVALQVDGGMSARTVANELRLLRSMFRTAVAWGLVPDDPAAKVGLPRIARPQRTYLTPDEMSRLIQATAPAWVVTIALPCLVGARRGEVLACTWPQISIPNKTIRFDRSMRRGEIHDVKSKTSRATVPLPESLVTMLEARRRVAPDPDRGLVCCRTDGSPLSDSKPNSVLKAALSRAGLPSDVRYHDLRRSWCVALIQANVPVRTILSLGRWASAQTFLDEYSEFLVASGDDAVQLLDEVVMRKPS